MSKRVVPEKDQRLDTAERRADRICRELCSARARCQFLHFNLQAALTEEFRRAIYGTHNHKVKNQKDEGQGFFCLHPSSVLPLLARHNEEWAHLETFIARAQAFGAVILADVDRLLCTRDYVNGHVVIAPVLEHD